MYRYIYSLLNEVCGEEYVGRSLTCYICVLNEFLCIYL